MDYEKKYKEAFERAKECHTDGLSLHQPVKDVIEYIFSELKEESEDERIRKALLNEFIHLQSKGYKFAGLEGDEIISWLKKQGNPDINPSELDLRINKLLKQFKPLTKEELTNCLSFYLNAVQNDGTYKDDKKQCEQKSKDRYTFKSIPRLLEMIEPTDRAKSYCQKLIDSLVQEGYATDAKIVSNCLKQMNGEKVAMATMDKSADKVEPKFNFKVGQWIVATGKRVYLITKIDGFEVTLVDIDGNEYVFDTSSLNDARLWTIQHANNGDVLATKKGNPFIYDKNRYNNGLAYYYAGLDVNKELTLKSPHHMLAHFGELSSVSPATKEQRDLLFSKMREADYEFDFEKKELKKIEQKHTGKVEPIVVKDFNSVFSREQIEEIDKRIEKSQRLYNAKLRDAIRKVEDFPMTD